MLGVPLSEGEVRPLLGEELSLSAINGLQVCVLAGPEAAIAELERSLLAQDVACRRVSSSHAFHSKMLDPIVAPLTELVGTFDLQPPQIPYVSNLTGTWITDEQATDAGYWGRHSRHPVRFADGVGELWQDPDCFLLEVGPGHTLSTMAVQHPASKGALERVLSTMRHAYEPQADLEVLLGALGQLWIAGVPVDWAAFHGEARRLRVPLPTYPFERQRYWIEPGKGVTPGPAPLTRREDVADWFYIPSWKRTLPPARAPRRATSRWLVFDDRGSLSQELTRQLEALGDQVVTVSAGKQFAAKGDAYTIRPVQREDYEALLTALAERDRIPGRIVHLWNATPLEKESKKKNDAVGDAFYSLLFLTQALEKQDLADGLQLAVISSHVQSVTGEEVVSPERATLLGLCKVIPHELPHLTCRSIDVVVPNPRSSQETWLVERIISEAKSDTRDLIVAYRGGNRWVQTYEPAVLPEIREGTSHKPRKRGVYLITGALSDIGLALAQYLARTVQPRLILLTHLRLPPIEEWEQDLATRDPQDPIGLRMRAVQELETLGAEMLLLRADVTSPAQMEKALRLVHEQYGAIHGVIHAAGSASGEPIHSETPASADGVLGPKVQGARILETILSDAAPDFVVLCSSLTALVGGSGRATTCAADAFLDALAHARWSYNGTNITSVNWDAWATDDREQVSEAFHRILAHNHLPQIAVCTRHLPTLIARNVELQPARAEDDGKEPGQIGAEHPRPNLPTAYAAPSSKVEQELAGIWQRLLGIGKVGRNDSFFRLGGHSLVAIQLINRVRDTFEVEMDIRSSFEAPTIAELAERIEQARQAAQQGTTLAITPIPRDGALPLSLAQQQLWASQQAQSSDDSRDVKSQGGGLRRLLAPLRRSDPKTKEPSLPLDSAETLNLVTTLHLAGSLDLPALERSLNEVVRRHEVLRTTFVTINGRPVQVFTPPSPVTLPLLDLQALSENEQETRVQDLVAEETRHPFDPAQGPLWRVTLLKPGSQMHVLLLNMHRLISDERSVEILIQELATLYEADVAGPPPTLSDLAVQYADFAAWQWAWLQGGALDGQQAYWRQQLGGSWPTLALPTDRFQSTAPAFQRARHPLALSPALTEALRVQSQQQGNTLFITLLAAFKALLHHLTGQSDIVVGTPVFNRNRSEVEDLIGPFGNTLALRTDLSGNPAFNELLGRVREVTLGAYAHQDLPFALLLKEMSPDRPPVLPVTFVLQNEPLETLTLPGLTLGALEIHGRGRQSDLTLALEDMTTGRSTGLTTSLRGALEYNATLFNATTIAQLASDFQTLLENVVAAPERRLAELLLHDKPQPAA
jgi:NAD(P)-dependent dehydrogenase (short-subunit alcohol dehydrogenase family)/acyl carrier protein